MTRSDDRRERIGRAMWEHVRSRCPHTAIPGWDRLSPDVKDRETNTALAAVRAAYEIDGVMELKIPGSELGPHNHQKTLARIELVCDFEPHGRASETWEWDWRLTLVGQMANYRKHGALVPCARVMEMHFHEKTLQGVLDAANKFLTDINYSENKIKEGE